MSSDRTPADGFYDDDWYNHPAIDAVIDGIEAAELVASNPADSAPIHGAVTFLSTCAAAGYRVAPIPDDNTRAEVDVIVTDTRAIARSLVRQHALAQVTGHRYERIADLLAAAYLSGDREERPGTEGGVGVSR